MRAVFEAIDAAPEWAVVAFLLATIALVVFLERINNRRVSDAARR